MGVSNCLTKALDIGRRPREEWKAAVAEIPVECPHKGVCTGGLGCQDRIAEYLRTQWQMNVRREKQTGGGR